MSSEPESGVREKHRRFTADDKARILSEYELASSPIDRATVLRANGVYSSLISNWRKQRTDGVAPKRGRPPNPEALENRRLHDEIARLKRRLDKSERTVVALGKAHELLQLIASESEPEEPRSKSQ